MIPVDFVKTVERAWSEVWAEGGTQQDLADRLNINYLTLRSRLRYRGYRLARGGQVVSITAGREQQAA